MAPIDTNAANRSFHEPWTRFAAWAADELGCALAFDGSTYRLERDSFDSPEAGASDASNSSASKIRSRWSLRRSGRKKQAEAEAISSETLLTTTTQTELLKGLIRRLSKEPTPPNLVPQHEPHAVHELTDRLFDAYQLDEGKALVAGCHLEEVPFIRRTVIEKVGDSSNADPLSGDSPISCVTDDQTVITHHFFDARGEIVKEELVEQLGLNETSSAKESNPRLPSSIVEQIATLKKLPNEKLEQSNEASTQLYVVVWARRASGRLRFEFGEQSVEASFDGWARTLEAPPIVCPRTGRETYSLTTLDDGEIVASEEVVQCEVTSNRHVSVDLERCTATGKLVEPDLLKRCPQTSGLVLKTEFRECPRCRVLVPKNLISPAGCRVCLGAQQIAAENPTFLAIKTKNPEFAKLSQSKQNWQLAETDESIVLVHKGWLSTQVATFDKNTLKKVQHAKAYRLISRWRPV